MENWVNNTEKDVNVSAVDADGFYTVSSTNPIIAECEPTILKSEVKEFLDWKWWIGGVIMMIVACVGFCANTMSMAVLLRPKIREVAFNQLLVVLCVVDTLFLCCNSLSMGHALGLNNKTLSFIRECMDVFAHVSMCASVLMIVALTCERHFAINSPHEYRVHIRITKWWKHLGYYVVPVTLCSFLFNIPLFINLQRSWMEDVTYLKINLYLRMLHPMTTTGLAPVLILLIFNIKITRGIRELQERTAILKDGMKNSNGRTNAKQVVLYHPKNDEVEGITRVDPEPLEDTKSSHLSALTAKRQNRSAQQNRREIRMAYVTFAIVGIFLCFNLPRIAVGGYEVSKTWLILHCVKNGAEYMPHLTFYYWDTISRLLMVINSSINFLIYCAGSDQFKDEFCKMFLPNDMNKRKPNANGNANTNQNQNRLEELEDDEDDEEFANAQPMSVIKDGKAVRMSETNGNHTGHVNGTIV